MKSRKAKRARPRLSRSVLEKLTADLAQRIGRQLTVAESIAKVAAPTGETLVGSVPMLTVIGVALNGHLQEMRQIELFAGLIRDRVQS